MTFAERLKKLRDKGGPNEITQVDLGVAMGLYKSPAAGQARIKRLESGAEPTASELIALSEYFKISIYDLLGLGGGEEKKFLDGHTSITLSCVLERIPPEVVEVFGGDDEELKGIVLDLIASLKLKKRFIGKAEEYGRREQCYLLKRPNQDDGIPEIDTVLDQYLLKKNEEI